MTNQNPLPSGEEPNVQIFFTNDLPSLLENTDLAPTPTQDGGDAALLELQDKLIDFGLEYELPVKNLPGRNIPPAAQRETMRRRLLDDMLAAIQAYVDRALVEKLEELRGRWAVWLDDHGDDKHTVKEIVQWLDTELAQLTPKEEDGAKT